VDIGGPYALFWVLYLLLMIFATSIAGIVAAVFLLIRLLVRNDRS
jgi:hypothetical protein